MLFPVFQPIPSAGYAADMLVRGGATVMFSEVTEVRDGVHMLAARCRNSYAEIVWQKR